MMQEKRTGIFEDLLQNEEENYCWEQPTYDFQWNDDDEDCSIGRTHIAKMILEEEELIKNNQIPMQPESQNEEQNNLTQEIEAVERPPVEVIQVAYEEIQRVPPAKKSRRDNASINIGTAIFKCFRSVMPIKLQLLISEFGPKRDDYKGIDNYNRLIRSQLNKDFLEIIEKHLVRMLVISKAADKPALMLYLAELRQGCINGKLDRMKRSPQF